MVKSWRKVKDDIESEIDKIWWDEPEEVTMCKKGIFPSGASVDNQVLGNLVFLIADTQAMGWKSATPIMKSVLSDPDFDVEQCKKIWKYSTLHIAKMLGSKAPPGCPAPWLNVPKIYKFSKDIEESMSTISEKEELEDLLWSWFNYINCMNRWFFLVFPWHLGKMFPLVKPEDIEEIHALMEKAKP